jgi:hypothetical protein
MDASQKGTLESRVLVMWIIWAAMLASLVIYIVICNLMGDQIRRPMGPDFPLTLFRNILFGLGIAALITTHFIRKFILGKPSGGPGPAPESPPPPQDPDTLYAKYTTVMVISLALCESVGIFGLVLFLLGDSFRTMYTFMVISAAGMVYYRPKREEIEALSRKF